MDYDQIIDKINGKRGSFQYLMFGILSFACFTGSMEVVTMVIFLTPPTNFTCCHQMNDSISLNQTVQCERESQNCSNSCFNYIYDTRYLKSSLVTEFDLVCDKSIFINYFFMAFFLGQTIGIMATYFSDKFGRRKIILIFCIMETVVCLGMALVKGLYWQILFKFLRGLSMCLFIQTLTLLTELVTVKRRTVLINLYWLTYPIAMVITPGICYIGQYWRTIKLLTLIPNIFYISYFFLVPESPRWLILNNYKPEAEKVFKRMSWWNGTVWKSSYLEELSIRQGPSGRIRDLFLYRNTRNKLFVMCFILWSFILGFNGLMTDPKFFHKNPLLSLSLQGLVEVPASLVSAILAQNFGRKKPLISLELIFSALIVMAPTLRYYDYNILSLIIALIAKFLLGIAFCIVDCVNNEVHPTSVRANGVMISRIFGYTAGILVTFIKRLENYFFLIPGMIFSVQILLAALSFYLIIPEMGNLPLADTVQESDTLYARKEKKWLEQRQIELEIKISTNDGQNML